MLSLSCILSPHPQASTPEGFTNPWSGSFRNRGSACADADIVAKRSAWPYSSFLFLVKGARGLHVFCVVESANFGPRRMDSQNNLFLFTNRVFGRKRGSDRFCSTSTKTTLKNPLGTDARDPPPACQNYSGLKLDMLNLHDILSPKSLLPFWLCLSLPCLFWLPCFARLACFECVLACLLACSNTL